MYKFNERLKLLRIENNKTQREIAIAINITDKNYQKLEYGTSKPSFDTLIKLADYYNVSLDYLVGRTENNSHNN